MVIFIFYFGGLVLQGGGGCNHGHMITRCLTVFTGALRVSLYRALRDARLIHTLLFHSLFHLA